MDDNEKIDSLSGAEHFLVGISPQYWAHTPLTIKSLTELGLVDGIDCIAANNEEMNSGLTNSTNVHGEPPRCKRARVDSTIPPSLLARFIPVSKCELQGVIVNVDRRSNGSCLYLLDDGTGVIDCVYWADNAMYSLPSLVPHDEDHRVFRVGDVVRVFGKIKCVSICHPRNTIQFHGREWKVQDCVREVHITSISSVPLNSQSNHWLRCLLFDTRDAAAAAAAANNPSILSRDSDQLNYLEQRRVMSDPVRNGPDVLRLLGSEIASKATERRELPASDDAHGAWRIFGVNCKCDLPYLDSLLYCHCQAKVVPLDPHFKFRDAVLELLLRMESKKGSQLRFRYKAIVCNASLQKAAAQAVANETNTAMSTDRLFMQTFAALRNDGIVALIDHATDTYLLISRTHVLDPHYKKLLQKCDASMLERRVLQNEQPTYLRNVPGARLNFVKKTLTDNR